MSKQIKMLINGKNHGKMHQMSVQNSVISAFTGSIKIDNKKIDNFKIMSLDAVCDLFLGAIEIGGLTKRNMPLYTEVKKFKEILPSMYGKLKVADSICMEPENKYTLVYAAANAQRNTIRKKMNEFREKLSRIAWNAKINIKYIV